MDFTNFINSKDIRKFFNENDYEFSPIEAAWLIYQCKNATVTEKHEGWKYIIEFMPDVCITPKRNLPKTDSLHAVLQKYMDIENKWLSEFKREEPETVYISSCFLPEVEIWCNPVVCSSWQEGVKSIVNTKDKEQYSSFRISKGYVGDPDKTKAAYFNSKGDLTEVGFSPFNFDDTEIDFYLGFFDSLHISFPIPFKAGDILYDPFTEIQAYKSPFVFTGLAVNTKALWNKENDTAAYGYFLTDAKNCQIVSDYTWDYMNLEKYEGELKGKKRALKAFSSYVKGEIGVPLLCEAYRHIMTDDPVKTIDFYSEEDQCLAGIAEYKKASLF